VKPTSAVNPQSDRIFSQSTHSGYSTLPEATTRFRNTGHHGSPGIHTHSTRRKEAVRTLEKHINHLRNRKK
jgi:hypothetical protein